MRLLLLSMTYPPYYSGVDRFVDLLLSTLSLRKDVEIVWVELARAHRLLLPQEFSLGARLRKLSLPLPHNRELIAQQDYWAWQYYEQVGALIIQSLGNFSPDVIHLHSFELMAAASYIKQRVGGYIITHVHYIPWKSYMGRNELWFNKCYAALHEGAEAPNLERLYSVFGERQSYEKADCLIVLSRYAQDFICKLCPQARSRIVFIPNGIDPNHLQETSPSSSTTTRLVFVGGLAKEKGLHYVLQALRIVHRQGLHTELHIAGSCTPKQERQLRDEYPELQFVVHGLLSGMQLSKLYERCAIGLLPSLQEQCSFAALEMMGHGLAIVATGIEGLDELFEDGQDALKLTPHFSSELGLFLEPKELASHLVRLIRDVELCERLGLAARAKLQNYYSLQLMGDRIYQLYQSFHS